MIRPGQPFIDVKTKVFLDTHLLDLTAIDNDRNGWNFLPGAKNHNGSFFYIDGQCP